MCIRDRCYHIILRYHQDLQQGLLLNQGSPAQAEQLLQPSLATCTTQLSSSQKGLRRSERRGRNETSAPSPPVGLWDSGTSRTPQGLWTPKRIDWQAINRESTLQQNLHQKIVDQINQEQAQAQAQAQAAAAACLLYTSDAADE